MVYEGNRLPELNEDYYTVWRDTVWRSIRDWGTPFTYQQNFTASWNLPINKIPIFNWVTSNVTYNSIYNWQRVEDEQMGNVAGTTGTWQFNGQLNFEQLYNKVDYLKNLDTRMRQQGNTTGRPFQSRTYTETVNLKGGETQTINHRLNSNRVQITATNPAGETVRISQSSATNTSIGVRTNVDTDSVLLTIISQDPNFRTPAQKVADISVRSLMMVRRARITYRETNSMTVPGFTQEPGFIGQSRDARGVLTPGIGFTFGFFDEERTLDIMDGNGWLIGENSNIVNPAIFTNSVDLDIQASLEPLMGLRIELNARQTTQSNRTVLFTAEEGRRPTTFTGSYNITTVAIGTAFRGIGNVRNNYRSETYETFRANRQIILDRLNQKYDGTLYPNEGFLLNDGVNNAPGGTRFDPTLGDFTENSPDVLIPAFIAAYTGRDVNRINMSPLIQLSSMLPNWRVTYDGLTRIPWIRERFRTVSLAHGYTCRYTIGSYTSPSTWVAMESGSEFGFVRNNLTGDPTPSSVYDIPSVAITEQFAPLIGINVTMRNSMTASVRLNKGRNLALNLSSTQLVERTDDEIVVGFGYTISDFDVILGLKSGAQSRIKNDLKINVDVSYKDNKMLLRKLDEDITQATSGNQSFGVKIMADYVFSSKLNLQMFFDHMSTNPLISSSFPVSTTNFGLGVRFMLTR
jgi:cell surface protein SprA